MINLYVLQYFHGEFQVHMHARARTQAQVFFYKPLILFYYLFRLLFTKQMIFDHVLWFSIFHIGFVLCMFLLILEFKGKLKVIP